MSKRKRTDARAESEAATRLESVVSGEKMPATDFEQDALRAVAALGPVSAPREEWRAAVKERLMRDGGTVGEAHGGVAARPVVSVHTASVDDQMAGGLFIADVEEIGQDRADQIAKAVAEVTEKDRIGRGHE